MTRILRAAIAAYVFSALTSVVTAQSDATATAVQVAGAIQTLDCYSTLGSNSDEEENATYQSSGHCQEVCTAKGAKVMITSGGFSCYCGDTIPPSSEKVDSSECNIGCGGYKQQTCGGVGYFQYYLTGLGAPTVEKENTTSSAKPSSATESATNTAKPIVVTATPTNTPESSNSGGGSSKVGIAVGVVVGVIAVAAIAGAAVFFYKRRRNQQLQEEHARNAAISGFTGKGGAISEASNDSRLDPSVYSARRDSLGSIADHADFSRRILQVRNPDRDSRASHV